MRMRSKLAACAALLASTVMPAAAADQAPVVVYGAAPAIVTLPPTGYLLDPSDARPQVYVVDEGPSHGAWVGAIAQPTYSEGGYVYLDDCPAEVAPPSRRYPYVRSYHGGRGFDAPPRTGRQEYGRRYGEAAAGGPVAAYRYRPAPDARIIRVEPRAVPEMHTSLWPR
jgi:hypothetical protein